MRIKSTVLQVLAAACLGAGLLYAMGIEGGAQLGPARLGRRVRHRTGAGAGSCLFHALGLCRPGRRRAGPQEGPQGAPEHREGPEEGGVTVTAKEYVESLQQKYGQLCQQDSNAMTTTRWASELYKLEARIEVYVLVLEDLDSVLQLMEAESHA